MEHLFIISCSRNNEDRLQLNALANLLEITKQHNKQNKSKLPIPIKILKIIKLNHHENTTTFQCIVLR